MKGPLSKFIEIIGGGTPKRSEDRYWNGKIPWLSIDDFNNIIRNIENTKESITELGLKNSSTKLLNKGSIVISARGTVGKIAQLKRSMTFNQSCYGLESNNEFLENDYLFYLLQYHIKKIKSLTHGSSFNTIIKKTFDYITVDLPSKKNQKKTVKILGRLDEKIEHNKKMNETLEEIAKTLFKSWFVDFDPVRAKVEGRHTGLLKEISDLFPDSFEVSEKNKIPKGWKTNKLTKILNFKNGYAFKNKDWKNQGIPVIKIKNIKSPILYEKNCSFISVELAKENKEFTLCRGDILLGMTGYVGEVCLVPKLNRMPLFNQRVGKIIPISRYLSPFIFSMMRQSNFKNKIEEISYGSAQQNVSSTDILKLEYTHAPENIMQYFSDLVSPILNKLLTNYEENLILINIRDTLLPRIISGELNNSDEEKFINEVSV